MLCVLRFLNREDISDALINRPVKSMFESFKSIPSYNTIPSIILFIFFNLFFLTNYSHFFRLVLSFGTWNLKKKKSPYRLHDFMTYPALPFPRMKNLFSRLAQLRTTATASYGTLRLESRSHRLLPVGRISLVPSPISGR